MKITTWNVNSLAARLQHVLDWTGGQPGRRAVPAGAETHRRQVPARGTARAPGTDKFAYKMRWLAAWRPTCATSWQRHPRLVLLGDFNIAPEDRDSYDPAGLRETIHHTSEEREHFRRLLAMGLVDSFRLFEQPEKSYSWWDYRMLGYQKNRGLRIDHMLVSEALKPAVKACTIDRVPRKWKQPSDHAPVTLEF
jgi:exodeoxyribonuclease-3